MPVRQSSAHCGCLVRRTPAELYDYATEPGLEVLVETHNLAELEAALTVLELKLSGSITVT